MFRLFAEEYGLWNQTDPYAHWRQTLREQLANESPSWHRYVEARAIWEAESEQIHTPEEAIARSFPARDGYSHLVMTVGPSGAGKSTWIEKNFPEYHRISLDDIRETLTGKADDQSANRKVLHTAHEQLKSHLRQKQSVVWDATNTRRDFRQPLIELGINYGAMITFVIFHVTASVIAQRNQQRQRVVPASVIKKQLQQMQWPYLYDAHHTLFIDEKGNTLAEGDCLGELFAPKSS
jgi:predicted kinase